MFCHVVSCVMRLRAFQVGADGTKTQLRFELAAGLTASAIDSGGSDVFVHNAIDPDRAQALPDVRGCQAGGADDVCSRQGGLMLCFGLQLRGCFGPFQLPKELLCLRVRCARFLSLNPEIQKCSFCGASSNGAKMLY